MNDAKMAKIKGWDMLSQNSVAQTVTNIRQQLHNLLLRNCSDSPNTKVRHTPKFREVAQAGELYPTIIREKHGQF
jgi:hypothetical protein